MASQSRDFVLQMKSVNFKVREKKKTNGPTGLLFTN